jgi:L-fuculose-phosphate aldolase
VHYFSEEKERELLDLKQQWGFSDPRNTKEFEDCDVCANDIFRDSWAESGVERNAFEAPPAMGPRAVKPPASADTAELIKTITEQVMAQLQK